jgi:hypothetical protein
MKEEYSRLMREEEVKEVQEVEEEKKKEKDQKSGWSTTRILTGSKTTRMES